MPKILGFKIQMSRFACAALTSLSLTLCAQQSLAQSGFDADRLLDPAYLGEQITVLEADPENINQMWLVAAIASKQGAYDEAISVLERILIYFPRDARVRVELGAVYSRIGAFSAADRQFKLAKTLGPTPNQSARIAHFEPRVAAGLSGVERIGEARLTFGYNPNINKTPDAPQILSFDLLTPTPAKTSSASATLFATNQWIKTLDTPQGEQLSFALFAETTRYTNPSVQDQSRVGIDIGAVIPVGANFDGYALAAKAGLARKFTGSSQYDRASLYLGMQKQGSSSLFSFGVRTTVEDDTTGARLESNGIELAGQHRLSAKWSLGYSLHVTKQNGGSDGGQDQVGAGAWASWSHNFPASKTTGVLLLAASFEKIDARAADPTISTLLIARDRSRQITLSETIRFSNGMDLILGLDWTDQRSNVVNNRFDAVSASITLTKRF